MSEANKELARRAIALWSTGDLAEVDRVYSADYVNHQNHDPDNHRELRGPEAMREFVREFRTGMPDFRDRIDLQVAEGDLVATRFTSAGNQSGPFLGYAPSGRHLSWTGTTIDRVVDGFIVESWCNWDMFGMLQQLATVDAGG